jgi:ATP-dependent Clp protease ATP-binding subunit ClpA
MCVELVVRVEPIDSPTHEEMRVSPRMAAILQRAAEIGRKHTGKPLVGTETVLLALAEEPDGIAGRVLQELGVRAKTRRRLDEILSDPSYAQTGRSRTTA